MNFDDMLTGRFYLQGDIGISLEQRVKKAAEVYLEKTGVMPDRAHVNPSICNLECSVPINGNQITVIPDPTILEAITWIGIGNNQTS